MVPPSRIATLLGCAALVFGCGSSSAETGASAGTEVTESQPSAPAAEPDATVARRYADAVIAAAMAAAELELVQAMTVGVAVLQSRISHFFEALDTADAPCIEARLRVFFGAADHWRQAELGDAETPEWRAAWQAMTRGAANLDANLARLELPEAGADPLDELTHGQLVVMLRTARERCASR